MKWQKPLHLPRSTYSPVAYRTFCTRQQHAQIPQAGRNHKDVCHWMNRSTFRGTKAGALAWVPVYWGFKDPWMRLSPQGMQISLYVHICIYLEDSKLSLTFQKAQYLFFLMWKWLAYREKCLIYQDFHLFSAYSWEKQSPTSPPPPSPTKKTKKERKTKEREDVDWDWN